MADVPVGLSNSAIRKALAELRAFGEIQNVPPPQLDPILAKAKKELELKPGAPPAGPTA